jgi:hypothetical protein
MDAYDKGFQARQEGEPETANPYPPDTEDALDWVTGWLDLDEHLRLRDEAFEHTFGIRW